MIPFVHDAIWPPASIKATEMALHIPVDGLTESDWQAAVNDIRTAERHHRAAWLGHGQRGTEIWAVVLRGIRVRAIYSPAARQIIAVAPMRERIRGGYEFGKRSAREVAEALFARKDAT